MTEAEVQEKIEALFKAHPVLGSIEIKDEHCCSGCVEVNIGQEYGWNVAQAWEELQSWYWLLDRNVNGRPRTSTE